MILSSVVFPQPDGPSKAINEPVGATSETWSKARKAPKFLQTPSTWMLMALPYPLRGPMPALIFGALQPTVPGPTGQIDCFAGRRNQSSGDFPLNR